MIDETVYWRIPLVWSLFKKTNSYLAKSQRIHKGSKKEPKTVFFFFIFFIFFIFKLVTNQLKKPKGMLHVKVFNAYLFIIFFLDKTTTAKGQKVNRNKKIKKNYKHMHMLVSFPGSGKLDTPAQPIQSCCPYQTKPPHLLHHSFLHTLHLPHHQPLQPTITPSPPSHHQPSPSWLLPKNFTLQHPLVSNPSHHPSIKSAHSLFDSLNSRSHQARPRGPKDCRRTAGRWPLHPAFVSLTLTLTLTIFFFFSFIFFFFLPGWHSFIRLIDQCGTPKVW